MFSKLIFSVIVILLIIPLLIIPVNGGITQNTYKIDDFKLFIDCDYPENQEMISHFEYGISFNIVFNFTGSSITNITNIYINNFTVSYYGIKNNERDFIDKSIYLDEKVRNTTDTHIWQYKKFILEQVDDNPHTRSDSIIFIDTNFTIMNDKNSTYSFSTEFDGPVIVNSGLGLDSKVISIALLIISVSIVIIYLYKRMRTYHNNKFSISVK